VPAQRSPSTNAHSPSRSPRHRLCRSVTRGRHRCSVDMPRNVTVPGYLNWEPGYPTNGSRRSSPSSSSKWARASSSASSVSPATNGLVPTAIDAFAPSRPLRHTGHPIVGFPLSVQLGRGQYDRPGVAPCQHPGCHPDTQTFREPSNDQDWGSRSAGGPRPLRL